MAKKMTPEELLFTEQQMERDLNHHDTGHRCLCLLWVILAVVITGFSSELIRSKPLTNRVLAAETRAAVAEARAEAAERRLAVALGKLERGTPAR